MAEAASAAAPAHPDGWHGPTVLDRTLSHADGWIPGHTDDSFDSLGDRITELRERAAALGKPMEVTLNLGRPNSLTGTPTWIWTGLSTCCLPCRLTAKRDSS